MSNKKKSQENKNAPIWAALITGIVTIIVAILGLPPLIVKLDSILNPTPTPPVTPSLTMTLTDAPFSMPSETSTQEVFTSIPNTPTFTPTSTQPPSPSVMTAQIVSNYSEGKIPLAVTFNASSSFVTYPDGSVETCEFANVCTYTWDVREKNGGTIHGPEVGGGKFSYTFTKKGEYTVVVYVCRGQACNFAAASVIVLR